jgi:FtsZ-binding cell division protein ZapB
MSGWPLTTPDRSATSPACSSPARINPSWGVADCPAPACGSGDKTQRQEKRRNKSKNFHAVDYPWLTRLGTIDPMINHLDALAEKTDALIRVVEQLRQENTALRSRLAALNADQRGLQERLNQAAEKVAGLLEQMPQEN